MAILSEFDLTTLCITHDIDEVLLLGHKITFLSNMPTSVVEEMDIALPELRNMQVASSASYERYRKDALEIMLQQPQSNLQRAA